MRISSCFRMRSRGTTKCLPSACTCSATCCRTWAMAAVSGTETKKHRSQTAMLFVICGLKDHPPGLFRDLADRAAWHAECQHTGRDIPGDHAARADHRIVADSH